MSVRSLLSLPLLALATLPAAAQERAVMGGFQIGVAQVSRSFTGPSYSTGPTNPDWKSTDDGTAFDLGFHVSFNLQNGRMIRIRVDDTLSSGTTPIDYGNQRVSVTTIGVLGEYLYHLKRVNQGLYLMAGLGFEETKVDGDGAYSSISASDTKGAFAWDAGVGYQFTPRVGLDLRYASSQPTSFGRLPWNPVSEIKNDRLVFSANFSF